MLKTPFDMRRIATAGLRIGVVLVGVGALAFLLGEPHLEGRNANATLFEVYFKDPFLAYVYLASVPLFVGLHRAFKALGYVGQGLTYSPEAVKAVRTVRRCALAILGFVAVSGLFIPWGDPEDRPQGIVMRLVVTLPLVMTVIAAARFERVAPEESASNV